MACLLQTLGGTLGGRSGRPLTHSSYTTNWDTTSQPARSLGSGAWARNLYGAPRFRSIDTNLMGGCTHTALVARRSSDVAAQLAGS